MIVHHVTDTEKREICTWNYTGEYAIYNLPSYDELAVQQAEFLDPKEAQNYYSFLEDNTLIGYARLCEKDQEIMLGIGVHPAYCGKHYGQKMLAELTVLSQRLYPAKPLCLEVRTWNIRAIKCYQNSGFRIQGNAYERNTPTGLGMFYKMILGAKGSLLP